MAKRKIAEVAPGGTLVVLATDPEAPIDLAAWAAGEQHGYSEHRREGFTEFRIVRRA